MNLPNRLTILRIFFVPIICLVWLFPYEQFDISLGYLYLLNVSIPIINIIVLTLFCIASITDFFDGNIARKNNLVTTFGKFADPIADKLLINSTLIIMCYKHMIPLVPVILMILRDTVVDACRMMAAQKGEVVSAGILGKIKTVLQIVTIIVVLLNNFPFELLYLPVSNILVWFTAFVSVAGGYSYFMQSKKYIFESM